MLKTRAETNETLTWAAPQKALSTELVAGLNMNGANAHFTSYRLDSFMHLSCTKVNGFYSVRIISIVAHVQEPQV
jgi:hypothetical protein